MNEPMEKETCKKKTVHFLNYMDQNLIYQMKQALGRGFITCCAKPLRRD
jgi:hypothetical protein